MSEHQLDARHLLCPMPVIKTQQQVKQLKTGDVLTVTCTDPGAKEDIPCWCRIHGHEVIAISKRDNDIMIEIKVCQTTATKLFAK